MIKANELRIGNYYKPTDGSEGFKKVTANDLVAWSMGAVYGHYIPLTPEILERCGFACLDEDCDLSIGPSIYFKYDKDASTVHLWIDDYPFQYFDFLHELQNIYYWLKKEELKIDSN